jgi:hypothetical protein
MCLKSHCLCDGCYDCDPEWLNQVIEKKWSVIY